MLANQRVFMIKQKIIEHHGRVQDVRLYDAYFTDEEWKAHSKKLEELEKAKKDAILQPTSDDKDAETAVGEKKATSQKEEYKPAWNEYTNDSAYLYEIFDGTFGWPTKKEAAENMKTLFYNFNPYDKKDPVLLTLMQHEKLHD